MAPHDWRHDGSYSDDTEKKTNVNHINPYLSSVSTKRTTFTVALGDCIMSLFQQSWNCIEFDCISKLRKMYPSSPTFRRAAELYEAISSSQHVVNDILGRAEMHRVLIYNDHNLMADSVKDNHFIYKTVQHKTRSYSINCFIQYCTYSII